MPVKSFSAKIDSLYEMLDFVEDQLQQTSCGEDLVAQIRLATEEVLANIINYAYPDSDGSIEISCEFNPGTSSLELKFTDQGIAFDPLQREAPDLSLSVEERPIGGLGIFFVGNIMDNIDYRREQGCNILSMRKQLSAER